MLNFIVLYYYVENSILQNAVLKNNLINFMQKNKCLRDNSYIRSNDNKFFPSHNTVVKSQSARQLLHRLCIILYFGDNIIRKIFALRIVLRYNIAVTTSNRRKFG